MSTEPQLAQETNHPERTGSPSPESGNSPDSNQSKALSESLTPDTAPKETVAEPGAAVEAVSSNHKAVPAVNLNPPAPTMTGRPAFPENRVAIEPAPTAPLTPKPALKKVRAEAAPAAPVPESASPPSPPPPAVETAPAPSPAAAEQQESPEPQDQPVPAAEASSPAEPGASVPGVPLAPPPGQEELGGAEMDVLGYDELMADYGEPALRSGDLCQGQVVSVDGDNVIVHYGGKTEGIVPLADFQQLGIASPTPGQEIEVIVESLGGPGDYAALSFLKAQQSRVWEEIEKAFRSKELLAAKVVERVKGGLSVDIGIPAFLPGSQADVRPVPDLDSLVGQEVQVRIVKLSRGRGNVVVSRRALLEEELRERRQKTLAELSEGAIVTGVVKNVTNYGAFIDLGGIDGLLHVTDVSWGRVRNPAEVLQVGQSIPLKVLKFDGEKERVSLSLKHMQPDPWENIQERFQEGVKASGRVVSLTDYGAFVELGSELEGLIHVSELSWSKRLKHPSKVLKLDQQVEAVITQINSAERRISLSLKRLQPDPWTNLGERYPIGQIVEGRVRNLTSYGAFVEIEEGVDGLVHVSDLSWSTKVKTPKDELKKGQMIRAAVLHVDQDNRRISLGIKQLEPDVWETFFSLHLVGDDVKGQITRFAKFGAFVELAPGVEGLCHNSEMSANSSKQRKPTLRAGQEYEFRIIKIDEFDKKISLSRRACESAHAAASTNGSVPSPPVEPQTEAVHSLSEESV